MLQQLHVRQLPAFVGERGGKQPVLLLDVREPWEVTLAPLRLQGTVALDIPLGQLPARLSEVPASQPVVCICHHGVRSLQAVAYLMHHGHEDVYNLAGGTEAWSMEVDPRVPRY